MKYYQIYMVDSEHEEEDNEESFNMPSVSIKVRNIKKNGF